MSIKKIIKIAGLLATSLSVSAVFADPSACSNPTWSHSHQCWECPALQEGTTYGPWDIFCKNPNAAGALDYIVVASSTQVNPIPVGTVYTFACNVQANSKNASHTRDDNVAVLGKGQFEGDETYLNVGQNVFKMTAANDPHQGPSPTPVSRAQVGILANQNAKYNITCTYRISS
jgi:hypothetical protein